MNKSGKQLKRHALALGGCLLLSMSAATVAQTDVQVDNDGLTLRAIISSADNVLSTSIRVVGPDGFVFEDRIEDGALQWIPEGDLADGFYSWEIWTVTVTPGAPMLQISAPQAATPARVEGKEDGDRTSASTERKQATIAIPVERFFDAADKRVHTESGTFEVRDGWLIPSIEESPPLSQNREPNLFERGITAVLDFLVPSAHAQQKFTDDLEIEKSTPRMIFDSTLTTSSTQWDIGFNEFVGWYVRDMGPNNFNFIIRANAPSNALVVASNGAIGLGTSAPDSDLHIADTFPAIRFDDTDDAQVWSIFASQLDFAINDNTAGTSPIRIAPAAPDNSIRIASNGNVGIGTGTPSDPLHVRRTLGFQIRLDDGTDFARFDQFSGVFRIGSNTNANQFRLANSAPTNSLTVDGSGNIGLGTDAPASLLHLNSPTSTDFLIESGAGEQGSFSFVQGDSARWVFRTRANSSNFEISRRNPDGTPNDRPIVLSYGTGNIILENRLELRQATEPPAPPAGGTVYVDSASGDLKVRFANGTIRTIASN